MTHIRIGFVFALFFMAGLSQASGQVCGISGSKINSSCGEVIDLHSLEYEIFYAFNKSVSRWDSNGTLTPMNGNGSEAAIGSGLLFRMTFGAFRNTEIGATVDRDAEEASLGIKWMPFHNGGTSLAVAGGMKFCFGEELFHPDAEKTTVPKSLSGAILLSKDITPSLSVDLNAGYSIPVSADQTPSRGCLDLCCDIGWFMFDGRLQPVMGAGYRSGVSTVDQERFSLLTLYPGFTVTAGRSFEILVAMPHDLYGINHSRSRSVICGLTLMMR
jgi:hypothetical protein